MEKKKEELSKMTTPKTTPGRAPPSAPTSASSSKYPSSIEVGRTEISISQATKERAEAVKGYIEGKYSKLKEEEKRKREGRRRAGL